MSYILDALRKSDQQRRLGGVPTLTYADVAAVAPQRSAMLSHGLLGGALMVALGMAVVALRPSPPEPVMVTAMADRPPAVAPRQAAMAQVPVAPGHVEPEPIRREPIAAASPALAPAGRVPGAKVSAAARNETRKLPSRAAATSPGRADSMSNEKPVTTQNMPLSIRRTLPVMAVAVHAYSNTAQDRLVSINGRMLREGDSLAPDLRLEQITPDGMIFTYRGYRFRQGAQ